MSRSPARTRSDRERREDERSLRDDLLGSRDLGAHGGEVDTVAALAVVREAPARLLELALAAGLLPRPAWYQATVTWTRPW